MWKSARWGGVLLGPPWASVQDVGLAMHVTLCVVLSYTGISPRIEQGVPARGSFVPRGQRAMSGGMGRRMRAPGMSNGGKSLLHPGLKGSGEEMVFPPGSRKG